MKSKTKKIIYASITSIFAIVITLYFTWPLIFVYYLTDIQKIPYLDIKPKIITDFKKQDKAISLHDLGIVKANIKTQDIKKVNHSGKYFLSLDYETHCLAVMKWESIEKNEALQFEKHYEIYNTTPADVKLLNKPGVNLTIIINLILKAIAIQSDFIEIVNTDNIKIISQLYMSSQDNKKIMINVYDGNNKFTQSFILQTKTDENELKLLYKEFINSMIPSSIEGNFEDYVPSLLNEIKPN